MADVSHLKKGDRVVRVMAGIPMHLYVIEPQVPGMISLGLYPTADWGWDFDLATGVEVDAELNWGPPPLQSGSYICLPN